MAGNILQGLYQQATKSVTKAASNAVSGVLGGLASTLPINIGGSGSGSSMSTDAPEFEYLTNALTGKIKDRLFLVNIVQAARDDGTRKEVNVLAWLDGQQQVSMNAAAQYDAPFDQGIAEKIGGQEAENMMRLLGVRTVTKSMTSQLWQGSQHLQMSLTLLLIADTDAYKEVLEPVNQLMGLTAPTLADGGFLSAPGPTLKLKGMESDSKDNFINKGSNILSRINGLAGGVADKVGDAVNQQVGSPDILPQVNGIAGELASLLDMNTKNKDGKDTAVLISIGTWLKFPPCVIESVDPAFETSMLDPNGLPMMARVNINFKSHQIATVEDLTAMFAAGAGG